MQIFCKSLPTMQCGSHIQVSHPLTYIHVTILGSSHLKWRRSQTQWTNSFFLKRYISGIFGFRTKANGDIQKRKEETGSQWKASKKAPKLCRLLNFLRTQCSENRGQIPCDQLKSHKILANVNPPGQFCINPTLCSQFLYPFFCE